MTTALVYVGGTTLALLLLSFFFVLEDKRGHRIVLRRARAGIDLALLAFIRMFRTYLRRCLSMVAHTVFTHGIQGVLQFLLRIVRRIELRIEQVLRQSRSTRRTVNGNRVRNHLDEIADHKEESALSTSERNKLLQQ